MSGLKNMINRLLRQAKEIGELKTSVNTGDATEMLFHSMLGTSIGFGATKATENLDRSIKALTGYLDSLMLET
jgi:hypothetical protein